MRRIRHHLTFANVASAIALFVALGGGTAVALNGSNTVQSDDLGPGPQVKAPDIATGAVTNPKIASGAVGSGKVADESLTGTDLAPLTGADIAGNSLTGDNINESSLGEVPSATLGGLGLNGGVTGGVCDPESGTFITCVATGTIDLPAPTRVLIIGSISAVPEDFGSHAIGHCYVGSSVAWAGEAAFVNVKEQRDDVTMSGVTGVLGPGPMRFGIDCNENFGGISYEFGRVSLVELSPG